MNKPTIEAQIHEKAANLFYNVKLHAVPIKGDFIDFYSRLESSEGKDGDKSYIVESVVHVIADVVDKLEHTIDGSHQVRIYVKKAVVPK